MPVVDHVKLSDQERSMYTAPAVSDRVSRLLSLGLGLVFGGIVLYMVLAATVLDDGSAPGVRFGEITGQPIMAHQPPGSTLVREDRGSAATQPGDSARRYVVRRYVTEVTPDQARSFYLRQFGQSYAIVDTHDWDTDRDWVLRGNVRLSEQSTADPPTLSVRVAIGRQQFEDRTRLTISLESDF